MKKTKRLPFSQMAWAHMTLAIAAVCVPMCIPGICQAQLRLKQKVILRVPDGHNRWLVAETCTIARLLVTNEAFRKRAAVLIDKDPGVTYDPKSVAIIGEVDRDGECVWVSVQPDGPEGWLYSRLVELTSDEKRKVAAEQAEARERSEAAEARRQAAEKVDPTPPLQLLDYKGTYNDFSTTIVGRVRNNTKKTHAYVQITFTLYDENGNQVGTALANINNLEPGAIWKFKAVGLTRSTRFKLSGLTGF